MTRSLIAAMILAHGAVQSTQTLGFAQTPRKTCCDLKAAPKPGSPAELTTTITNLGQPVVHVSVTSGEHDFMVRVTSDAGQEPNRTDYGKRLLTDDWPGRWTYRDLSARDTFTQGLDLGLIFELSPGTYNVSLTREVTVENKNVQLEATTQIRIP